LTVYSIWQQGAVSPSLSGFQGTLTTEFSLSQSGGLTGIWLYSPATDTVLPSSCAIYLVSNQTIVSGTLNNSPSWSGAAGSGWIKCTYDGSVTLSASTNYVVAVFFTSSATAAFNSLTWPVTNGIITGSAALFFSGGASIQYPLSNAGSTTYWVDAEVTTASPPPPPAQQFVYQMKRMP
jgi:hypothetical protein